MDAFLKPDAWQPATPLIVSESL